MTPVNYSPVVICSSFKSPLMASNQLSREPDNSARDNLAESNPRQDSDCEKRNHQFEILKIQTIAKSCGKRRFNVV